jgi:hypothetical protein
MANSSFLGSGLSFPLRIGADGDFVLSQEVNQVEESIQVILGTKPGERRMLPTFGSDLHKLVFERKDTQLKLFKNGNLGSTLKKSSFRQSIAHKEYLELIFILHT